jgi:hypothetical protein
LEGLRPCRKSAAACGRDAVDGAALVVELGPQSTTCAAHVDAVWLGGNGLEMTSTRTSTKADGGELAIEAAASAEKKRGSAAILATRAEAEQRGVARKAWSEARGRLELCR